MHMHAVTHTLHVQVSRSNSGSHTVCCMANRHMADEQQHSLGSDALKTFSMNMSYYNGQQACSDKVLLRKHLSFSSHPTSGNWAIYSGEQRFKHHDTAGDLPMHCVHDELHRAECCAHNACKHLWSRKVLYQWMLNVTGKGAC